MKINIILPYNTWGGAFRSTYELANHMAARGESVEIYMPFFPYLAGNELASREGIACAGRGLVRSVVRRNRMPWFDLKVPLKMVPLINDRFVRDADIVMANHWPTAYSVAQLSTRKGCKFHFVRDTAPIDRYHNLEVGAFRLGLHKIVTSPWLKEYLEHDIGVKVAGVVGNGTNMADFEVPDKKYNQVPTICMMYVDYPSKGMSDGFAVLKEVKQRSRVKVLLFGWKRPNPCPIDAEFRFRPVKQALRDIYAETDIFLAPSLTDGWNNTPLEAMAAKCAVVATKVGGIPVRTIPGETALVVEPGDVNGMVEAICSLIANPEKLRNIGRRGNEHIKQFTWEEATSQLLCVFTS